MECHTAGCMGGCRGCPPTIGGGLGLQRGCKRRGGTRGASHSSGIDSSKQDAKEGVVV